MKQILFFAALVTLTSCVNQRQKSNITGRTDEVYFTPSDTRIKVYTNETVSDNSNSAPQTSSQNYSGSYSDRLRNFGSTNRFNYSNYQPMLVPTLMYNNYTGWGLGLSYGAYNSPFSPYYGCNMPFNNPFYANGWGGNWMTGYNPYYTYNPYLFNNPYGYGGYGYGYGNYGYNNYNPYYNNNSGGYNSGGSGNYSRRTGTSSPSGSYNNSGVRNSNTTPMRSGNNNGSYNSGRVNSSTGSSSSGSSSSGRSGGSTSGSSTRRR